MPSYRVLEKGFYGGCIYDPNGKRKVLHRDKAFPKGKTPCWLEPIKQTAAETKAAKAAEVKATKAAKAKAAEDQKDIQEASFMGEGESATKAAGSSVESL